MASQADVTADRQAMPPPPPRSVGAKRKVVLEEDTYAEAIEAIVERDFFPHLPKLQNQLEWLQAVQSGDPAQIKRAQLNIAQRRAGLRTPFAHEFFNSYQGEDNASFQQLQQKSIERKRAKMLHHLQDKNKPLLLTTSGHETDEYGSSGQTPGSLQMTKHVPKNSLYYDTSQRQALALTAVEEANIVQGPPKAINYGGTRSLSQPQLEHTTGGSGNNGSSSRNAGIDGLAAGAGSSQQRGKLAAAAVAPGTSGYGYMRTPQIIPGVEASPIMTWGDIASTPLRLEGAEAAGGFDSDLLDLQELENLAAEAEAGTASKQFSMPEVRSREAAAQQMKAGRTAAAAANRHRGVRSATPVLDALRRSGATPGRAGAATPGSTPVRGSVALSAAGLKLAHQLKGVTRPGSARGAGSSKVADAQLRASYKAGGVTPSRGAAAAPGGWSSTPARTAAWQTAQKQKKAEAEQRKKNAAAADDTNQPSCLAALKSENGNTSLPASDSSDSAAAEDQVVVPKIYYATRTHSQIAQVVRELKRTAYKPRMAVLGSRPHYCINKRALNSSKGVDGECEELMKDSNCKFQKNARTLTHGMVQVHDIEDLHRIGNRHKACPYFTARHLAETAELIFCPYSYLLDPNIRRATKIEAADAVLIFDEAHNIEDQARESGSTELDMATLVAARDALRLAATMSSEGDAYVPLADALALVVEWLARVSEDNSAFKPSGFERFEQLLSGQQMLAALTEAGLEPQAVEHLWSCYTAARQAEEKAGFNTEGEAANEPVSDKVSNPGAGGAALGCMSQLLTTLRLLYGTYSEAAPLPVDQLQPLPSASNSAGPPAAAALRAPGALTAGSASTSSEQQPAAKQSAHVAKGSSIADYRLAVQKWVPRDGQRFRGRGRQMQQGEGAAVSQWGVALCLWCLNPAVVFKSLSEAARCVLLTSGTLSPLDSFSGELGLRFHLQLEAKHVVDMNRQVLARVVSHGPDGRLLNATFKEADKLDYQDSLGQLCLQASNVSNVLYLYKWLSAPGYMQFAEVVSSVPDGVLLFLPSYSLMDKLRERWTATGVWNQLQQLKHIVPEPRHAGADFDKAIDEYYTAIREGRGGLFIAVCRGKASEGIDFADGNARCVMVVGIPFPNVKDSKVGLKKDYNNNSMSAAARARPQHQAFGGSSSCPQQGRGASSVPPKLLSGDLWYSQQAFRALNQAVGRCIRHKLDYGAILLVDERFRQPRNQSSLSKWELLLLKSTLLMPLGGGGRLQGKGGSSTCRASAHHHQAQ
eukprot:gene10851-11005_t